MAAPERTPLSPYHRRLLMFLSVATFFEGYDFMALTQLLPNVQREFGLSAAGLGWMSGLINAGTIFAYLLVRKADVWGAARATLTIAGYTTFTFITGLSSDVVVFTVAQFFARLFLIAEWATALYTPQRSSQMTVAPRSSASSKPSRPWEAWSARGSCRSSSRPLWAGGRCTSSASCRWCW